MCSRCQQNSLQVSWKELLKQPKQQFCCAAQSSCSCFNCGSKVMCVKPLVDLCAHDFKPRPHCCQWILKETIRRNLSKVEVCLLPCTSLRFISADLSNFGETKLQLQNRERLWLCFANFICCIRQLATCLERVIPTAICENWTTLQPGCSLCGSCVSTADRLEAADKRSRALYGLTTSNSGIPLGEDWRRQFS